MNEQLKEALNTLLDVQDASGLNRKKDLLYSHRSCETLKDILYFVFNPYIRTGIGLAKFKKGICELGPEYFDKDTTIQGVFTYLIHNNTGRDIDVARVRSFIINQDERFRDLLSQIFTKSMKLGISTTTIHKIWSNLIPGFGIQLACKWQDNKDMLLGQEIFITEKLDGNRCFAQVKDHKVIFYSRSGREINGMEDIKEELSRMADGWYDGELLAKSFEKTQSTLRTKGDKRGLMFNIFDYLTEQEVINQIGYNNYADRRYHLEYLFKGMDKMDTLNIVPLIYRGKFNEEYVLKTLQEYTSRGSEGLMINLNTPYQFNRTNQLLKVKNMYTLDLRVVDIKEGTGENKGKVGALVVNYKHNYVGVGSGLSKEQRELWWEHPELIKDKLIEVQAFEETSDKNGNLSLRFPVFKKVREDKTEVSYD